MANSKRIPFGPLAIVPAVGRLPAAAGLVALALAALATPALSQDCETLRETMILDLQEYLEKDLDYQMTKRKIALIDEYRLKFGDPDLFAAVHAQATGAKTQKQIASEQAQVRYQSSRQEFRTRCQTG